MKYEKHEISFADAQKASIKEIGIASVDLMDGSVSPNTAWILHYANDKSVLIPEPIWPLFDEERKLIEAKIQRKV